MAQAELRIRGAKRTDTKQILSLMRHRDVFRFLGEDYNEKNIHAWLRDRTNHCLVAELDGKVVGLAISYPFGFGGRYFNHIRLFDLAVDPRYRKHGIGGSLSRKLFTHLRERKVKKIMAFVESDNARVRKFNKTIGMDEEGEVDGLFLNGKTLTSGVVYGKVLA